MQNPHYGQQTPGGQVMPGYIYTGTAQLRHQPAQHHGLPSGYTASHNHSSDRSLFDVDSNGEQENLAGNAEVEEQERELRAKLMERFHA